MTRKSSSATLACLLLLACLTTPTSAAEGRVKRRSLLQTDASQRAGVPSGNPFGPQGSANTANAFSSAPSSAQRQGALGFNNAVSGSGSNSAADTTVVSGVRGVDNTASGSGLGRGPGSGTIGSNRGYTSAPGRKLMSAVRSLLQIDFSQRAGIARGNAFGPQGSANTANFFSSGPSGIRRIGALGFGNAVSQAGSFSAADTTVVAGVRGVDNTATGSGLGRGPGSGTIGSNRGRSSAPGRKLMCAVRSLLQSRPVNADATAPVTIAQNPDAGFNNRGAISATTPAAQGAAQGQAVGTNTNVGATIPTAPRARNAVTIGTSNAPATSGIGRRSLLQFRPVSRIDFSQRSGIPRGNAYGAAAFFGRRSLLQRSSTATFQPARLGTSTSLNGADRSAASLSLAGRDAGYRGYGSGSSGGGGLASANSGKK